MGEDKFDAGTNLFGEAGRLKYQPSNGSGWELASLKM
jgi:hypothetical protein